LSHELKYIKPITFNYEYNQRDATIYVNLLSQSAVYVSSDDFAHHQEHLTVFTASGDIHCNNKFVITSNCAVQFSMIKQL
jgi:hypothetical protein